MGPTLNLRKNQLFHRDADKIYDTVDFFGDFRVGLIVKRVQNDGYYTPFSTSYTPFPILYLFEIA